MWLKVRCVRRLRLEFRGLGGLALVIAAADFIPPMMGMAWDTMAMVVAGADWPTVYWLVGCRLAS